jgi:hypothetical protein
MLPSAKIVYASLHMPSPVGQGSVWVGGRQPTTPGSHRLIRVFLCAAGLGAAGAPAEQRTWQRPALVPVQGAPDAVGVLWWQRLVYRVVAGLEEGELPLPELWVDRRRRLLLLQRCGGGARATTARAVRSSKSVGWLAGF